MRLSIPFSTISIQIIDSCSHNARIPPLPSMKRNSNVIRIIKTGRGFKIPTKLYELFSPVDCHSYPQGNQYRAQHWIRGNESINGGKKTTQGKEVPPNKLQCSLCCMPSELHMIHRVFPLICYQHNTNSIKITLSKVASINGCRGI